jgi:hypothetical protein
MYKDGDYVVILDPPKRSLWSAHEYCYIDEMVQFAGCTGKVVNTNELGYTGPGFAVKLPYDYYPRCFVYYEEWVRPATEAEARVAKFIEQVKS